MDAGVVIDYVSFSLLVLAALGWLVGNAVLPPPSACTLYNGRWAPEQTQCTNEPQTFDHTMLSCIDYLGVSVRTDEERYIAWFKTTYLSNETMPMEEEFYPGGG